MNKRLAIITVTTFTLLLTGGVSYAVINKEPTRANVVTTPEKQEAKVVATTTATIPATTTATGTTTPVQSTPVVETVAPTPVYRSFDQIIMDYPNMSQGYHAVECSHVIQAAYPNRFTPEKAEYNIRLISQKFASSCSASHKAGGSQPDVIDAYPLNYLTDYDGTGDFWQKNGAM